MKTFLWALVLVLACAVPPALADKPPKELFQLVISTSQLVHRGDCDVKSMNKTDVPCLIFYDGARDIVWLVLFDKNKDGTHAETHVIAVKDEKENIVWCRSTVCS